MMCKRKGFTLIEIMIALLIFAIIAMTLTYALNNIFNAKARIALHQKKLVHLQMALLLLERDTEQVVYIPNNEAISTPNTPPSTFVGTDKTLTFIQDGFSNPLSEFKRSCLQRVSYQLVGERLTRTLFENLADTTGSTRTLFNHVRSFKFSYLGPDHLIYPAWPPLNHNNSGPPQAVIMALETQEGTLGEVFNITGERLAHS